MAVSYICGFEMGTLNEAYAQVIGGSSPAPTHSVQTSVVHSGTYAYRATGSSALSTSNNVYLTFESRAAGGTLRALFQSVRAWVRVDVLPSANKNILATSTVDLYSVNTDQAFGVYITPSGDLSFTKASASTANFVLDATVFLTAGDGVWHLIELDVGYNAGAGARLFCDGALIAHDSSVAAVQGTVGRIGAGTLALQSGANADIYFDDVVWYDSSIPAGDLGKQHRTTLLSPISDNAVGTGWVRTDGTTATGLFNEVNTVPPAGNTSAVLGTGKHALNKTSTTTGNYDANCTSYTTAGITSFDTIQAVQAICRDAQQVTTQSPKAGAVVIASNPSGQTENTLDFGLQQGTGGSVTAAAMGTDPSGWGIHNGPVTVSPSVTLATSPVVRVGKRIANTREVDVDFMGIYVAWLKNPIAHIYNKNQAVNRSAVT